ncbi:MAG TPA: tetratricopeptide repeat protein [Candidatus Omnitrophica bacterium]|nr:MAG: hypothetical protein DRP69_02845 [Candidatus Omnitrophota bacterium]RKY43621.1 MAG: hypothetical protein DRP80_04745 [Candidatus Omnitrophota bacterium]HEC69724.1 tetratricopeptide repeat protein [Candidatus Omnitrophota bacterium]
MKNYFILSLFFLIFFSGEAVSSSPVKEQAKIYREEGYRLQKVGDLEGALSYYLKAVQIDPLNKEAYNDLGVVYEAMGDLDKAEQMYLKAIEIDSDYLPPYANLGFLYEKKNHLLKAIFYWKERYNRGKKGEYWTETAYKHLLKLGVDPKLEEERRERRRRLIRLQQAKVHFNLGFKALGKGLYKKAEEEFKTVIDLNPEDEMLLEDAKRYYEILRSW